MRATGRLPSAPTPMAYWPASGGLRLAGDYWGDPEANLVLLLHGAGQTRHAWSVAGQRLSDAGYFAVALDSRGHGDSDWADDGAYDQDTQVADLVAVLDSLGKAKPILVGASMGGGASLVAVGEGFVDAAALVIVDTAPRVEAEGATKIREFMEQSPNGFESLDAVADAIAQYQPHRQRV